MLLYDALIAPFTEFEFMRRALAAVIALALGGAPIGVFLMLRRMSLVGDAMAHAILPGAAIGFLLSGLNLWLATDVSTYGGKVFPVTRVMIQALSTSVFFIVSLIIAVYYAGELVWRERERKTEIGRAHV